MRRRRLVLSEKIFLIKKFYAKHEDWSAVQEEFNQEYKVQTSQQLEKLICQLVKRFEGTGSITQDFYFEAGVIIKEREDTENAVPDKKSTRKKKLVNSPSRITVKEETHLEESIIVESVLEKPIKSEYVDEDQEDNNIGSLKSEEQIKSPFGELPNNFDHVAGNNGFEPASEEKPIMCNKCPMRFATKLERRTHKNNRHSKEGKRSLKVECPDCGKMVGAYRVKLHRKTHIPVKERPSKVCPICSKVIYGDHNLPVHIKQVHESKSGTGHVCDVCGKIYPSKRGLKSHMILHREDRPFKCNVCSKEFATRSRLRLHDRVHSNFRPCKCSQCDKAFKDHGTLRVHMRQHTGESPYVCHICGRACKQGQNLRSHIRHVHSNGPV